MYFAASLFAAFVVTLLAVSYIAKMLLAKRAGIAWVFLATLVGSILAGIALVPLKIFVQGLEPMVMLIISLVVVLIVSSAAFKYINQMSWSGAITTNIANVVISLMTVVAAVFLNGESIKDTISVVTSTAKTNSAMVESVAIGEIEDALQSQSLTEVNEVDDISTAPENVFEPVVTEKDFLLPGAAKALEAKKKKVYVEPKFRVVSIGSIRSAVGRKIRILQKNGTTVLGNLRDVKGSDAIVARRLSASSGEAVTPISIARIRKLEVYR